jgi:hypothetical protein
MDYEELIIKYKLLEEENKKLYDELIKTKEHLKKYTAPKTNKTYYETHKEVLLEKMKLKPIVSDKRKEYNRKYYLKNKENNKI